jgi:hypothetical protein
MTFLINAEGFKQLLSGNSVYISDGIHATQTEVKLSDEARRNADAIVDTMLHKVLCPTP